MYKQVFWFKNEEGERVVFSIYDVVCIHYGKRDCWIDLRGGANVLVAKSQAQEVEQALFQMYEEQKGNVQ